MVNWLIDRALSYRTVVLGAVVCLSALGYLAMRRLPIDAIPDLSDNQVIVFTDWPGHSAQEVEDQVTYPLTVSVQGLPGVRVVRSQSAFGFSMIYVVFDDATDLYFARSRVLERLNLVTTRLPAGVTPTLGPDATGVGHVFWYTLESSAHSLRDLRTLQDWFVRYQLQSVPGVAEVASVGGHVQQYQVDVDPNRLRGVGVTLGDVVRAVQTSNANVGGNVVESNGSWAIVRGVGLIESVDDLARVPVASRDGVPVFVDQVATVRVGDAFRSAALVAGGREAVGGVVVARAGVNAREVIAGVKARLDDIKPGLPQGVTIVPFYDRSSLIDQTVGTLRVALVEEVILVTLAHVVFLRHLRSILIVTLPLPLAVLVSFLGMYLAGLSANVMSLAGIAIAIGVLVDAGIVVTESAFRRVEQTGIDPRDPVQLRAAVREAARLVGRPVFFSMAIILLAFVPVFALTGQEGKLFHPLAFTKTIAVLAATMLAVTLVPVLCTLLVRGRVHPEETNIVMRGLRRLYAPIFDRALRHPAATLATAAVLFAGAAALSTRIGSEFMPALDEGDLLFMPIADPGISLDEAAKLAKRQNLALLAFPEVASVTAKVGRADTSTDPSPLNMTETVVHLKPRDEWRPGTTPASLRAEMSDAVRLPGVATIWTMPIVNRIDMLTTGIRSEVGVKVYGSDLAALEGIARSVASVVRTIPGAANVYPEPLSSGQYLDVRIDRDAAARYGLSVGDVQDVVQFAIGETVLSSTIEGRLRFPIRVRYAPEFRADPRAIGDTLVTAPGGARVPLRAVADVRPTRGPAMISSENGLLVASVLMNVQDRDVGGFVDEARAAVAARVAVPPGYYVGWSGRYENQARARGRLQLVLPIVVAVIFLLLYVTYRSAIEAAHVLLAVPFALTGGVYLLWALDYNFSVAVWVGFIALFGTAVQTAVVMVIYLEDAVARRRAADGGVLTRAALREAVREGALLRLRPKVMTVATVVASLLPIMWSTRVGADVMKPLATPVLGGMVSSLLHVLLVMPVIFFWVHARRLPSEPAAVEAIRERPPAGRRRLVVAAAIVALAVAAALAALAWREWKSRRATPAAEADLALVARAGDVEIRVLAPGAALAQGARDFELVFRTLPAGAPFDAGDVSVAASMPMPGMTMTGGVTVEPTGKRGRYRARGQFDMAGAWQFVVRWNGPVGSGSASFEGAVR